MDNLATNKYKIVKTFSKLVKICNYQAKTESAIDKNLEELKAVPDMEGLQTFFQEIRS